MQHSGGRRTWQCLSRAALLIGLVVPLACDFGGNGPQVGKPAPDFEFRPLGGSKQRLSELRGQIVVINFFATWCNPCLLELPELDRTIARPLAGDDLVVLAIGIDQDAAAVAAFRKDNDYAFLIAADPDGDIFSEFTTELSVPQTFLIGPDGKVVQHLVGYESSELQQLKREIEALRQRSL